MLKSFVRFFYRKPDFVVGGQDAPYLLRWYIIPRNRFFNIYLHKFLRDDDDRTVTNNQSYYGNSNLNNGSTGANYYKHDLTSPYFNGTTNNAGRYGHQHRSR